MDTYYTGVYDNVLANIKAVLFNKDFFRMDFSLELKVNLHICFSSYEYYENNGHFMTYIILCDYVHKFVKTDVLFEGSPKIVKRIILNIRDYISLIFGFGEETGESYQINFDEVNPETDIFYKEELINEKDYIGENGDKRCEAKELFASLLDKDVNSVLNTLLALSKELS